MRTDEWTDVPSVAEGSSSSQQLQAPAALESGRENRHEGLSVSTIISAYRKKKSYRKRKKIAEFLLLKPES